MGRFEDAIQWVMNGGRARRACWARVTEYTQTTPPLNRERLWHIWLFDTGNIVQGWGGQVGANLGPDEPIRDGVSYQPSNDDRIADDWELLQPPTK